MIGARPPNRTGGPRTGGTRTGGTRKSVRKQTAVASARSARKSRRKTRLERKALQRRLRARAHLNRALRRAEPRSTAQHPRHRRPFSESQRRLILASVFAVSLLAGSLLSRPVLIALTEHWRSGPALLTSVAVQGRVRLRSSEIAQLVEPVRGQRIASLDTDALAAQLERHPWIAGARVASLPTGSLVMRIDERRPVATLSAHANNESFLVDAGGAVFAPAAGEITEGLQALVIANATVNLDHDANPLLARGAAMAERIVARGFSSLSGASLQLPDASRHDGWVVRSAGGELIVVLGKGDDSEIDARLDRLESLLQADLWAGAPSGRIDLRFEERAILHASVDL